MADHAIGVELQQVYRRLLAAYGPQRWWPGEDAFEVCIGAILTQGAAWANVERALARMKAAGLFSPQGLSSTPEGELAMLIRPAGYFNAKASKIKAFMAHLSTHYDGDLGAFLARPLEALRAELLSIYGIGEETADDIILYAAGQPSFVVDAYTRRIFARLGLIAGQKSYAALRARFMEQLPSDPSLYNEYHALLVRLGKEVCLKRAPKCLDCPLLELCPTGQTML